MFGVGGCLVYGYVVRGGFCVEVDVGGWVGGLGVLWVG